MVVGAGKQSGLRKKSVGSKKTQAVRGADLEAVFAELQGVLEEFAPPFVARSGEKRGRRDFHLVVPKPVSIPGAYGGKPKNLTVADLMMQTGFVGFYFMPIYMNEALKKKLAPELLKLLKGKTCFHVKTLTPGLKEAVKAAVEMGVKGYRERGWV
jgi:hypothetical protein